jgi:L-ascorbate metabolism protein UlaG (beta-lactamase superfamily)
MKRIILKSLNLSNLRLLIITISCLHVLVFSTIDEFGKVDMLFVPVGGFLTIGPETATKVCDQLKPKIIVPMHYRMPGLRAHVMFGFLKTVNDFLEGKNNVERIKGTSVDIEENDLPRETKIIVMSLK